jgi:cystathionine beta-lyase
MSPAQATYLAWIDAAELNLEHPAKWFEAAGVGVSGGKEFDGPGFVRLNFGCPRSTLKEALRRIKTALESRQA